VARILDDDFHPVPAVVIGKVAHYPHAGIIRAIHVGVAFDLLNVMPSGRRVP
jgi:hypothetical protein